jgi:hypothetical protein
MNPKKDLLGIEKLTGKEINRSGKTNTNRTVASGKDDPHPVF